jgi:hypothetical protein
MAVVAFGDIVLLKQVNYPSHLEFEVSGDNGETLSFRAFPLPQGFS